MPNVTKDRCRRCIRDMRWRGRNEDPVGGIANPSCRYVHEDPVVRDSGVSKRHRAVHLDVDGRLCIDRSRVAGRKPLNGKLMGFVCNTLIGCVCASGLSYNCRMHRGRCGVLKPTPGTFAMATLWGSLLLMITRALAGGGLMFLAFGAAIGGIRKLSISACSHSDTHLIEVCSCCRRTPSVTISPGSSSFQGSNPRVEVYVDRVDHICRVGRWSSPPPPSASANAEVAICAASPKQPRSSMMPGMPKVPEWAASVSQTYSATRRCPCHRGQCRGRCRSGWCRRRSWSCVVCLLQVGVNQLLWRGFGPNHLVVRAEFTIPCCLTVCRNALTKTGGSRRCS